MVLCFFAAAVFWIFNALNKTYSTDLHFPLRFEYDQKNYIAETPLPHRIKLNVSGSGWELLRKSIGLKLPLLVVPVEKPLELKKLVTNSLTPVLASQMGGLKINYAVTDTLQIQLDTRQSRVFHLKVDQSALSFRQGFGVTGPIKITPAKVELDGPASVLLKLPDTILIKVPASNLHKMYEEEVEVPFFKNEFIKRNPPLVNVSIPVSEVIVLDIKLKVRLVNLSQASRVGYSDSVRASFVIPVEKREELKLKLKTAEALIDVSMNKGRQHYVFPNIVGIPDYARLLSVDSVTVKF